MRTRRPVPSGPVLVPTSVRGRAGSGRIDRVNDPGPGAEGIDDRRIDLRSTFTFLVVGFECYLHTSVRSSPTIEVVDYGDNAPDGTDIGTDPVPRITFHWTR